jgi:hypothetical protein
MAFAIAALTAGCGEQKDATDKQLAALRAEIIKVRADTAVLADRLNALELARDGFRGGARPQNAATGGAPEPEPDRPELDVVRLAPESDGNRPVLRSTAGGVVIEGDGASRSVPRAETDGARQSSSTKPPASQSPPSNKTSTPSRRKP